MQQFILLSTLLLFTSLTSHGQNPMVNKLQDCQREWKYKDLGKSVIGTILFYDQPSVLCGAVSTASVALIRTGDGDTLRVLTMCNTKKDNNTKLPFSLGEKVTVTPFEKPSFRVDIIPVDIASCSLETAYFGIIQKVN
jgi:hypothetical protein